MPICFDIETDDYLNDWTYNGFSPRVTALGWEDLNNRGVKSDTFVHPEQEIGLNRLNSDAIIGHNIIGYDLPFLKKFYNWEPPEGTKVYDTYVLARLIEPESKPHSLEAWGERLGIAKVQVQDFSGASTELIKRRVESDVEITTKLWYYLTSKAKEHPGAWASPYSLEAKVQQIITEQEQTGVYFDVDLARQNVNTLSELMRNLESEILPQLPERNMPKSQLKFPPKLKFKKDGTPSELAKKYYGDLLKEKMGGWWVQGRGYLSQQTQPLKTTQKMELTHKADLKEYLISKGWKPTFWNIKDGEKTSPKIRDNGRICPNLLELGERIPNIQSIVEWNTYAHRKNTISSDNGTGLLHHPRLELDGRLPAGADTLGAVTGRMTHRVVANIPRVSSLFGKEMRGMFRASPGKVLVGWDASSGEDRMKGHYCYPYSSSYVQKLLDPEYSVHEENMALWGKPKPECKNAQFCLAYGGGLPKFASQLKVSVKEAEPLYEAWAEVNAPLLEFKKACEAEWATDGTIQGLDGRRLQVRKKHAVVNTACQSALIIVMKYAMCWWYQQIKKLDIPAVQVIHYHDEAIAETLPEYAEEVGRLGVLSIKKAGQYFKLNVPLTGEYLVGQDWSQTH